MITLEPPRDLAASDRSASGDAAAPGGARAWSALGLSRSGLSRFLHTAQAAVGLEGEVEVLLAGDRTLRRLNRAWRGKDKPTDVLSFPAAIGYAGDLAISLETAARQAREHGYPLHEEVRILLLHGLLHLAGMDHEADRGEMAAREAALRKRLRMRNGLIARTAQQPAARQPRTSPPAPARQRRA